MGIRNTVGAAIVLTLLAGTVASAQQIIFIGSGTQRNDGGIVAGSALNAGAPMSIDALGFIDVGDLNIPEPSSLALLSLGALALRRMRR